MKIRIHRNTLIHGVQMVQAIAERRTSLPILSSFLLEARDTASVRIAATNTQISLDTAVPAEVDSGGVVAIGAKTFFEIVRNLPEKPVEIEVDESFWMHVRCGRVHFRIVGQSPEGYPDLPTSGRQITASALIPAAVMTELIERTSFSISTDETRMHLNSALFQGDGKVLRMVTTDGHRLTCFEHGPEASGPFRHEILIPQRGIGEIRRLIEGHEGNLTMTVDPPHAFFQRESFVPQPGSESFKTTAMMAVKLVEATFPPYRQVIPRDNKRRVHASKAALSEAIRRVSTIASGRTSTVRLRIAGGKLTVLSDNPDIGVGEEEIDVRAEGGDIEIGFNGRYLLDAIAAVTGEEVQLNLGDALDGCVVREVEDERYLAVVMPVRL